MSNQPETFRQCMIEMVNIKQYTLLIFILYTKYKEHIDVFIVRIHTPHLNRRYVIGYAVIDASKIDHKKGN